MYLLTRFHTRHSVVCNRSFERLCVVCGSVEQINELLRSLDYSFVPLKALQQRAILEREQRILSLLTECDKE
jgi:hypothetical protein